MASCQFTSSLPVMSNGIPTTESTVEAPQRMKRRLILIYQFHFWVCDPQNKKRDLNGYLHTKFLAVYLENKTKQQKMEVTKVSIDRLMSKQMHYRIYIEWNYSTSSVQKKENSDIYYNLNDSLGHCVEWQIVYYSTHKRGILRQEWWLSGCRVNSVNSVGLRAPRGWLNHPSGCVCDGFQRQLDPECVDLLNRFISEQSHDT